MPREDENLDNNEPIVSEDPQAQKIIDDLLAKENGGDNFQIEDEKETDDNLPSDDNDDEDGEELFANKYKSVEELKKGIVNIGSDLPQYIIDGMTPEALEQHYNELNTKQSKGENKNRKHAQGNDEAKDDNDDNKSDKPASVDAELWDELETEFNSTGGITTEQYDKLNKAGIPDTVIDKYIDGIAEAQIRFTEKVYELAGGQDEYSKMKSWAESNMTEKELITISKLDHSSMLVALKGVKAMYAEATGSTSSTQFRGSPSRNNAGNSYKSIADYNRDVSDHRYNTDMGYRNKVDAKLERSKF